MIYTQIYIVRKCFDNIFFFLFSKDNYIIFILVLNMRHCRWPSCLRLSFSVCVLLKLRVPFPPGGMDVCLLWVLCVVTERSLRRADPSSIGVVPTVVSHCVWSRNFKNEAAMVRVGLVRQRRRIEHVHMSFSCNVVQKPVTSKAELWYGKDSLKCSWLVDVIMSALLSAVLTYASKALWQAFPLWRVLPRV
jgi:hypothetical protein